MNSYEIIVKPTNDCNLACEYCYVGDKSDGSCMDEETLQNTMKSFGDESSKTGAHFNFIWHGGEPLLMGIDFYRQVIDLQNHYFEKGKASNGIQTNGTLLTNESVSFLHDNRFGIGMSLDGPKRITDSVRKYKTGEGAFDDIMHATRMIKEKEDRVGVVSVLSRINCNSMHDVYDFFKSEGIDFKINPITKSGYGSDNYTNLGITPIQFGRSMKTLFDIWFNDSNPVKIDTFEQVVGNIITGNPWGCNFCTNCQEDIFSISPNGNAYPCGRFEGNDTFLMGNINEGIDHILHSPVRDQFLERDSDKIKECSPCEYKSICNSGCIDNGYMRKGDIMDRDYYCSGYKMLFKHAKKQIKDAIFKSNAVK